MFSAQKIFANISVCCYKFEANKFFCKNEIRLLCKRHARQNKTQFQYIQFSMTEIREIFAKINSYIFLSFKQDKNKSLLLWQFRDGQQARRKKAQCCGGNFTMVTICEILRKLISTFFWTLRRKKSGVMMAISRWSPFAKFCKN